METWQSRAASGNPAVARSFEEVVLPHLDAAYRLARWLIGNEHDAEDVVQDATLRAFRYFRTFSGGNGRAWFLSIVRNLCFSRHGRRAGPPTDTFDEEQHSSARPGLDPEALLLQAADVQLIKHTLSNLPRRFREMLVLRELEGLSYQELSVVLGVPMGTVMSGLSRARQAFRRALETPLKRPQQTRERAVAEPRSRSAALPSRATALPVAEHTVYRIASPIYSRDEERCRDAVRLTFEP
jgi:RNA polymerase sigma-70 factor (ECF subfamily)